MASVLLHWNSDGVTYSVRQVCDGQAVVYASGPGRLQRRAWFNVTNGLVEQWKESTIDERTKLAEQVLAAARD